MLLRKYSAAFCRRRLGLAVQQLGLYCSADLAVDDSVYISAITWGRGLTRDYKWHRFPLSRCSFSALLCGWTSIIGKRERANLVVPTSFLNGVCHAYRNLLLEFQLYVPKNQLNHYINPRGGVLIERYTHAHHPLVLRRVLLLCLQFAFHWCGTWLIHDCAAMAIITFRLVLGSLRRSTRREDLLD